VLGAHVLGAVVLGSTGAREHTSPGAQSPSGLIAGRVLDVTSGQPVAGVTVSMTMAAARPAAGTPPPAPPRPGTLPAPVKVLTDAEGQFTFTGLPNGRFTLRVQHDGYAPVRGAAVTLLDSQPVTNLVLQVGRHGVITGTVRDDAGDPIVGVGVTGFNRRTVGFRPMLFPRGSAVTDDRGQFRISDLPPGDYLICACVRDTLPIDKNLLTQVAPPAVPAGAVARQLTSAVMTFAPTFHPGRTRVADAVPVTVSYADDRRGIDVTMQPVRPWRVSGQLSGGGPTAGEVYKLQLIPEDDDPAAIGISAIEPVSLTPDGAFNFAGVTPGRYTVEAYPGNGKKGLWASVAVSVSDRDVTGVLVPLGTGPTVRGRIEFSGSAQRPDGVAMEKARIGLVPIVLTPALLISVGTSGTIGYSSTLSRDGSFSIEDVPPGQYVVNATQLGPAWQTVESITTGEGRSLGTLLDVRTDGHDGIVVTVSDVAFARLEASLTLGPYELASELRVAVFPVDRTFWSETFRAPNRFTFSFVSASGIVTFPAVPPGDYYVIDLPPAEGEMSPERMNEWAKRASTVRLRAGELTAVALKR